LPSRATSASRTRRTPGVPALTYSLLAWAARTTRAETIPAANDLLHKVHARIPLVHGHIATVDGLLELDPPGDGGPTMIITDQASYSDQVFGLFWRLGCQFSPRPAVLPDQRFWRVDCHRLQPAQRPRINPKLIITHWDVILRVAGPLSTGTVRAVKLLRVLQGGGRPTPLGRAIAELGRAAKTLDLLSYVDSDAYRRCIGVHINRHEGRHFVGPRHLPRQLARLSPLQTEHVLVLGTFPCTLPRVQGSVRGC